VVLGCSGSHRAEHEGQREPHQQFIEFHLGTYMVPIPATLNEEIGPARRNVMQLEFVMHAVVPTELQPQVEKVWQKHGGRIRDRIIELCRSTSLDDLQEPGLETLKSLLLDAARPTFGRASIDRLVLTDVQYQTLE
jgi:flagellar basal body-associated protein FliL